MSGDYLAVSDVGMLGAIIMYGTGSYTDHTLVAIWNEGELYICESVDPPSAVQCTKYDDYFAIGHSGFGENSDRSISILRLAPEYRARFDEKKAWEFFKSVEGLPYGFQTFLFGWIDTDGNNFPYPLSIQLLAVAFPLVERMAPQYAILWKEAFNVRMGTKGLSTEEIIVLLEKKKI